MSADVRINQFVARTRAEGPGTRACVWVQGCSIHCRGCFNKHMWEPSGARGVPAADLADRIVAADGIEGVTFLGGEPFEQAAALAAVARRIQAAGLSVMAFSGYQLEDLVEDASCRELLAATDLLVDGPYDLRHPDTTRPWVGSTNQRFWFLTDRYASLAGDLALLPNRLEVRLRPDGTVFVNGMARPAQLRAIRREVMA